MAYMYMYFKTIGICVRENNCNDLKYMKSAIVSTYIMTIIADVKINGYDCFDVKAQHQ